MDKAKKQFCARCGAKRPQGDLQGGKIYRGVYYCARKRCQERLEDVMREDSRKDFKK